MGGTKLQVQGQFALNAGNVKAGGGGGQGKERRTKVSQKEVKEGSLAHELLLLQQVAPKP